MTLELSIAPISDALFLVCVVLCKAFVYHKTLNVVAKGTTCVNPLWSLLATICVVSAIMIAPAFVSGLPPTYITPALAVLSAMVVACTIFITCLICDIQWHKVVLGALVLLSVSMLLDLHAPKLAAAILPKGATFGEYRSRVDTILSTPALRLTNGVDKATDRFVDKGFDALATFAAKSERNPMNANLFNGIGLFAERKKMTAQMTDQERAAYRAEMQRFLAQNGLEGNSATLSRVRNFNTNDVATVVAALAQSHILAGQKSLPAEKPVQPMTGSLATTLLTAKMPVPPHEPKRATVAAKNKAQVVLSLANSIPVTLPTNRIVVYTAGPAEAATSPIEPVNRISTGSVILLLPSALEDQEGWISASEALTVKGFLQSGTNTTVVLSNGSTLRIGDLWNGRRFNRDYPFVLKSTEFGKLMIAPYLSNFKR